MLTETPVLVTGASGFIGGRLAEILACDHGARVTGLGRTFREPAPAGVEHQQCDLLDADRLAELLPGHEVVFHVAAWLPRRDEDSAAAHAINVTATESLVRSAALAGCRRVVLVSSVAAYGLPDHDVITEDSPLDTTQRDLYGRTKALGEQAARRAAEETGIELVIVRPGMVYGPGSSGWTVGMYRLVKKGVPVLFGSGGHAYPVYVDDVVDMLIRCAAVPQAAGEAFTCVDRSIGWPQFFGYYGDMAGRAPRRVPVPVARIIAIAAEVLPLGIPLTRDQLKQYLRDLQFPTDKAAAVLDWQVQVPLDDGMARSEVWLREAGLA
jgi:nucleoside-diphosphate-sugar epimerase